MPLIVFNAFTYFLNLLFIFIYLYILGKSDLYMVGIYV